MKEKITLIICTYNRSEILKECLKSIFTVNKDINRFDLIIVDNNSSDNTRTTVNYFTNKYSNITLLSESRIGLSHARNTGLNATKTEWIIYLDDDVKISERFFERFFFDIENYSFDIIGGPGLPWFKYKKPKWLNNSFFSNLTDMPKTIGLLKHGFVSGFNCAFKKSVLEEVGGFNPAIGMQGSNIGYGEETLVQIQLRKKGKIIWFDPELIVYHLVLPHKLKLAWYIKSNYMNGVHHWETFNVKPDIKHASYLFLAGMSNCFKKTVKLFPRLFQKGYYIQNYLYDVFADYSRITGTLIGCFKKR